MVVVDALRVLRCRVDVPVALVEIGRGAAINLLGNHLPRSVTSSFFESTPSWSLSPWESIWLASLPRPNPSLPMRLLCEKMYPVLFPASWL